MGRGWEANNVSRIAEASISRYQRYRDGSLLFWVKIVFTMQNPSLVPLRSGLV